MNIQALPYVILSGLLYGSSLIASRFSVGQFAPTTYIGLRVIIASTAHLFVYWMMSGRTLPRDKTLWKRAIIMGIFGTAVPLTCVVSSLQYQSSGVTSLLLTTSPALTVILAHFLLNDERLTGRKIIGVSLALGGAIMLALNGENGLPDVAGGDIRGYLFVGIAITASATMTIYARKYLSGYNAFDVASIRMFTASIVIMPLSVLTIGLDLSEVTGEGYFALIYAAIFGTFLGFLMAFYNIKRFGATPASMTSYIIPIVAGIGGVIVIGEEVTTTMIVGMVVIISGISLLQEFKRRKIIIPEQS